MDKIEPWGMWHSHALAAGVSIELASLGRAVIRNFMQYCQDRSLPIGECSNLGADQHYPMMIALAKQQPGIAKAVFEAARASVGQDDEDMRALVKMIEKRYSDDSLKGLAQEHILHLLDAAIAN